MFDKSLYPKEIWRGAKPKASQLYRCVEVNYQKFVFEVLGGRDAMGNERWRGMTESDDVTYWMDAAEGLAATLKEKLPNIRPLPRVEPAPNLDEPKTPEVDDNKPEDPF